MPLEVDCHCGQRFSVSEALAGFSVHCRACGSSVAVPRLGGTAPAPPTVAQPQAAARAPAPSPPAPAPSSTAPSATELKGASSSYDSSPPAQEQEEGWFSGGVIGGLGLIL